MPARDMPAVKHPKLQESECIKLALHNRVSLFGSAASAPTHGTGFFRKKSVSAPPHYVVSEYQSRHVPKQDV